ncbi:hypothetical protein [Salinispora arenicola]|nr:hypothetical protein [Salinispora arenicola]
METDTRPLSYDFLSWLADRQTSTDPVRRSDGEESGAPKAR